MALPYVFNNFPAAPVAIVSQHEYNQIEDLVDWEWSYLGHNPPDGLTDGDGGILTLGSGSANSGDYVQGQMLGASIQLNRLAKTLLFTWRMQLSHASLCAAMFGVFVTNTNFMNTNVTDGFWFSCNQPGGPATGNWYFNNAKGSAAQYTGYTQVLGPATDTNMHTFSIRATTDSATLGNGILAAWIDGVPVGNGLSGAILTQSALRMSMAMGNGDANARTLNVGMDNYSDQQ